MKDEFLGIDVVLTSIVEYLSGVAPIDESDVNYSNFHRYSSDVASSASSCASIATFAYYKSSGRQPETHGRDAGRSILSESRRKGCKVRETPFQRQRDVFALASVNKGVRRTLNCSSWAEQRWRLTFRNNPRCQVIADSCFTTKIPLSNDDTMPNEEDKNNIIVGNWLECYSACAMSCFGSTTTSTQLSCVKQRETAEDVHEPPLTSIFTSLVRSAMSSFRKQRPMASGSSTSASSSSLFAEATLFSPSSSASNDMTDIILITSSEMHTTKDFLRMAAASVLLDVSPEDVLVRELRFYICGVDVTLHVVEGLLIPCGSTEGSATQPPCRRQTNLIGFDVSRTCHVPQLLSELFNSHHRASGGISRLIVLLHAERYVCRTRSVFLHQHMEVNIISDTAAAFGELSTWSLSEETTELLNMIGRNSFLSLLRDRTHVVLLGNEHRDAVLDVCDGAALLLQQQRRDDRGNDGGNISAPFASVHGASLGVPSTLRRLLQ